MGNIFSCNNSLCGKFVCNVSSENIIKKNHFVDDELIQYTKQNDILLIPLVKHYHLDNLYPVQDEVESWNIFIIGNDKTYILAKCPDFKQDIDENILNTKGISMNKRIFNFLDMIWDKTLTNNQEIQTFIYTNGSLFLLNTYQIKNKSSAVIGAICFMRHAGLIDKSIFNYNQVEDMKEFHNLVSN